MLWPFICLLVQKIEFKGVVDLGCNEGLCLSDDLGEKFDVT